MYRTRFKEEIVAEFLPPSRKTRRDRVIILCDGMPSIPRKQPLAAWLAAKGYWIIYPRYRGAWESDGQFLRRSPAEDIRDILDELPHGIRELAFGKKFSLSPNAVCVIGGSFGGTTALLASLDSRVHRVIANCPVVNWKILKTEQKKETSNPSYANYIRQAFGSGYRLTQKNWDKLHSGTFFNPAHHIGELDPEKILMFHAKDDPYIPWRGVESFAKGTGIRLKLLSRGGHLRTELVVQKYWKEIQRFFRS